MKPKLDANGNVVTVEVNGVKQVVYVHDDGKEAPLDAKAALAKISELNGEARDNRLAKEAAETKLAAFEGIEDPKAAKAALETVKSFNGKQALSAEELDRISGERVTAAVNAVEEKYKPVVEKLKTVETDFFNEKIGGSFARSKFITEKAAIPADFMQAKFGSHFAVGPGGKIIAKGHDGKEIYSKTRPGEIADFDESLEILVDGYANKTQILKGTGQSGGGTQQNNGGGSGNVPDSSLSPQARLTQHRQQAAT